MATILESQVQAETFRVRRAVERASRSEAVTLIHGDCRNELRKIASRTVDAVICDPIYPEVRREYGRI
ncbi:MAG: hypothetical protein ACOX1P_28875 [Thermoguttaceae bacterium]|jgi:predicted methyltransferase